MPKTEDGEFELILGNRQLLSVFFIVVVLLGVFFTMGYIVGRNSGPDATVDTARKTEPKPIIVDSGRGSAAQPGERTGGAQPSATEPQALPPENAKPSPAQQPAETATKEPDRAATKPEPASATPGEPQPGASYLQVAAVARPEAELFVDVLAKKGFHAIYAPIPDKPQLFRVLVGPFRDAAAMAQARTDLTNAGFKGFEALARKY